MASINAEAVAKTVIKKVRKGEKVVLGDIIEKQGYAPSISTAPTKVTRTKSYQRVIRPLAEGISDEIEKIKEEMTSRDISLERYETLANVMDKLVKNHQLLTGGATENIVLGRLSEEDQAKLDLLLNDKQASSQ